MNETIAIAIWILAVATMIAVVVYWFNRSKSSDYFKESSDYVFDDFYTLPKGKNERDY